MDQDGRNKRDLTKDSKEFAYGFSASPDGKRIAYHKSYQVYVADADGSNAKRIETGQPFNFVPQWSPDGTWLLFLAGEHYDCHPYVVRPDGSGLRKLASRNGYKGVVEFLDVPDFHGGSSDVPAWAADGQSVFYTAAVGRNVELFRVTLDGKTARLTETAEGSLHYHPAAFAGRQVVGLRVEERRRAAALRDAIGRRAGAAHHRPQARSRRHVAPLAAGRTDSMRFRAANSHGFRRSSALTFRAG